jgi:DNA-binding GntR family transcriptional regulator
MINKDNNNNNNTQAMRQADDAFAQTLYQASRKAFARNLRDALDAKDAAHADKVRRLARKSATLGCTHHFWWSAPSLNVACSM